MQTRMTLEACCRCGQPIAPGESSMKTASVDIDYHGRVVSFPMKAYHLTQVLRGRQAQGARQPGGSQSLPESHIDGSHQAAQRGPPIVRGLARSSNRLGAVSEPQIAPRWGRRIASPLNLRPPASIGGDVRPAHGVVLRPHHG